MAVNHFEVFGLARRHHPDFHQGTSAPDQATALETSARVNAAYRALRDPIARIEYLVRLEDGETTEGASAKPKAPPDLLAEMFEIQETLDAARATGLDDEGRARLREERARLRARHAREEEALVGPLSAGWDAAADGGARSKALDAFRRALGTRAYLRTVIDDLTDALGEGQEHVAHHRD